jgi:transcriptional regulator with XRE-family HTH domain
MRIKDILKRKKITYKDFAKSLGVSENTIKFAMNTNRAPTLTTLQKWATALNIPVWQILTSPEQAMQDCNVTTFFASVVVNGQVTTFRSPEELKEYVEKL